MKKRSEGRCGDSGEDLHTNGPMVIKPSKEMVDSRGTMGKEETNTNPRYGYEQYPRG